MILHTQAPDYQHLRCSYDEVFDSDDQWGSNIAALFALCAELWDRGVDAPAELEYSPGRCGTQQADPDHDLYESARITSTKTLLKFATTLGRYDRQLRKADLNY